MYDTLDVLTTYEIIIPDTLVQYGCVSLLGSDPHALFHIYNIAPPTPLLGMPCPLALAPPLRLHFS
jgi:hypothetical protein